MTVRLNVVPGWVPNLPALASPKLREGAAGLSIRLSAVFTYQYLLGCRKGEKPGLYARQTACIAGPKSLFMRILGQNGCFFKLHDIWYSTKT